MPDTRLEARQVQTLSQGLQQTIHLLSLDRDELSDYMYKQVQENPALEYVPPEKSAHDYAAMVRTRSGGRAGIAGEGRQIVSRITRMEELEQQLRLEGLPEKVLRIATDMLHHLNSRGYFPMTLSEYALENNVSVEDALAGLEALQNLGPAGIGARSVEECLELQLREKEHVDPLCYDLIRLYLLEIGKGSYRQIARETGQTVGHVQECVEIIKSLTPAPCSLSEETVQYIMPEFSVETDDHGNLTITFHSAYYPTFRTDATFERLTGTLSGEEAVYAKSMLQSARELVRAFDMRQSTMEKVAGIIVREQRAFFLGEYSLVPLRCGDVAAELGVHESTVYRALQNKYLSCVRGTFPLSHFFQREVEGGSSVDRAKELIREICETNGRLSDRAITEQLHEKGIVLSRRTVAKYRAEMEIESSYQRTDKEKD